MKSKLLMVASVLAAVTAFGAPSVLRKSGDCKLQVADAFDESKVVKVELANTDVQVTCAFRGGDFFGEFTLFTNPGIQNKSGRKLSVGYQAAFFDKGGELIACTAQSGTVDAKERETQFGSCMSKLPQAEFAKITSYKVAIYVELAKPEK